MTKEKETFLMIQAIALFLLAVGLLSLLGTIIEIFSGDKEYLITVSKILASLFNILAVWSLIKIQKWSYKLSVSLLSLSVIISVVLLFIQDGTSNFIEQVLSMALLFSLLTNKKALVFSKGQHSTV